MDTALKKSVITLNSQFRDRSTDPNSCDFITTPGFLTGLPKPKIVDPTTIPPTITIGDEGSGQPLFYGVEQVELLDATFTESQNNSPNIYT